MQARFQRRTESHYANASNRQRQTVRGGNKGTRGRSRVYFYFEAETPSAEHNSEIKHTAFTAALH